MCPDLYIKCLCYVSGYLDHFFSSMSEILYGLDRLKST
jgi:hypothetical protein